MAQSTIDEVMSHECPVCKCEFEIVTRGGHCQRFVTSLVVLIRPPKSDYVKVLLDGAYAFSS